METIKLSDLKVGDYFESVERPKVAATSGTLTKVSRVNVEFSAMYMGRIPLTVPKFRKELLRGGRVLRNGVVYRVAE